MGCSFIPQLRRRKKLSKSEPANVGPVHLACSHRAVRTQQHERPEALQHFRLFSLCSAGRNTGNLRFGVHTSYIHIRFYLEALRDFLGPDVPLRVTVFDLSPDAHDGKVFNAPLGSLGKEFDDVDVVLEESRTKKGYYDELLFYIHATPPKGNEVELVEGGGTDWTQKLLNNAKERLAISGIGSERVCEIWGEAIDRLDMLIDLCMEEGARFNDLFREEAAQTDDFVFDALTRLHARGCQVGFEILALLKNGFADGAHARWRTLHELAVVAMFLAGHFCNLNAWFHGQP